MLNKSSNKYSIKKKKKKKMNQFKCKMLQNNNNSNNLINFLILAKNLSD